MTSTELRVKELLREKGWTTKILAEKTGMSESYLTHIKNGTRRWNEDALKKLAEAFELHPTELFSLRKSRTDNLESALELPKAPSIGLKMSVIPVMGDIPSHPNPYNNQLMQVTTGYKDAFVPLLNNNDEAAFCLYVENNNYAPRFLKGDYLIISPEKLVKSGDVAAVEYGTEAAVKIIAQVTYTDEFIVLESLNHRQPPIALIKGKDQFRVIGKVAYRYQKLV